MQAVVSRRVQVPKSDGSRLQKPLLLWYLAANTSVFDYFDRLGTISYQCPMMKHHVMEKLRLIHGCKTRRKNSFYPLGPRSYQGSWESCPGKGGVGTR